jgi:cysteine-rich repeat protein
MQPMEEAMKVRRSIVAGALGLGLLAGPGCQREGAAPTAAPATPAAAPAAAPGAGAPALPTATARLTGDVVDYHDRALAGAQVTARDDLHAYNVSVFADGNGKYAFPDLPIGAYQVSVRIVGHERLQRTVQLGEAGVDVDFRLRLAEDPHAQLPASYYYAQMEWPNAEYKGNFALACANCHQIGDPLWRKPRSEADWVAVVQRMRFRGPPLLEEVDRLLIPTMMKTFNGGPPPKIELPPPPTGDATRAILWEYEVDPAGRNGCHDLELGQDGTLFTEDGFWMNPATFERGHYELGPGTHSVEMAPDGDMWFTITGRDLISEIDRKAGKVTHYEHPQQGDDKGAYPHTLRFDDQGRIWYTLTVSNHVAMFDPSTAKFTYYDLPGAMEWKGHRPIPVAYGLDVAPDQSVWWSQLLSDTIGVLDPKTGEIRHWQSPVRGPRRLHVGPDGVVWVPGYASGDLGRFDPRTEQWKVYPLPTEPAGNELPYALNVNRQTGDVWVAGSNSDTLIRFDPRTEKFTVYPLATPVDFTREIEFDDQNNVWTCVPDRGTGPEGPLSGRFVKLQLLEREGSCGDKAVQLGEQCDDGNTADGDGCSAECNWEKMQVAAFED